MTYFFVSGISVGVFLFFILITKSNKSSPDYILAFLLLFGAQTISITFLTQSDLFSQYPAFFVFSLSSPTMIGPLLFLYVKYQTQNKSFNPKDLFHFIPYCIISLLYVKFYFLTSEEKVIVLQQGGRGFKAASYINVQIIYLSGIIYTCWSLFMLWRFRKNLKNEFSNTDRIQFNWLLFLIIGIIVIWSVLLVFKQDRFISIVSTSFILILGYFGISQVNVFQKRYGLMEEEKPLVENENIKEIMPEIKNTSEIKYQYSSLSEMESIQIHKKLKEVLKDEKPYLNAELTLNDLAKLVGSHSNKVSEVINRYEKKTFYDLINELRIQEFLVKLNLPESNNYTFTSLAYDCGFNSKASFNRNFKKHTNRTPSEYLKDSSNSNQK